MNGALYRCSDCGLGGLLSCADCCIHFHSNLPFHRIKKWNGRYFEWSDLDKLGLVINLGHQGVMCPCYDAANVPHENVEDDSSESDWFDSENLADEEDDGDEGIMGPQVGADEPRGGGQSRQRGGCMIFADVSGVFRRKVQPCICPNALPLHLQLFGMELFSATIAKPSTAFTFRLLDQFHIEAMECKTSASNFFSKLRRLTNEAFPSSVPVCQTLHSGWPNQLIDLHLQDRYRELMRVSRQWRNLQALKRSGFGHDVDTSHQPGDLAIFCPTCPQPGINVPLTEDLNGEQS